MFGIPFCLFFCLVPAVCMIICFIAPTAPLCTAVNSFIYGMFGVCGIAVPLVLIITGLFLILRYDRVGARLGWMALMLFLIDSLVNVFSFVYDAQTQKTVLDVLVRLYQDGQTFRSGGVIGGLISVPLSLVAGKIITTILLIVAILVVLVIASGKTLMQYVKTPQEAPRSTAGAPCAYGETAGRI